MNARIVARMNVIAAVFKMKSRERCKIFSTSVKESGSFSVKTRLVDSEMLELSL